MQPSLRKATLQDINALVELRAAFLADFFGTEANPDLLTAIRSYFQRAVPAEEFVAYVAESENRIVSIGGLIYQQQAPSAAILSGRICYILNMYTVPAWRGRGLATAILGKLIDHAKATGCGRINLHAAIKARPIYTKAGFVAVDSEMRLDL